MTVRIVSYAINGRGMGHLSRQLAILRWVRRLCAVLDVSLEAWVLTSSEADTLARREGFPALKMPSKAMVRDAGLHPARYLTVARTWVMNTIAGLQPDILLVDTFPGGSFGELVATLELAPHRVLVRRRVRPEFAEEDAYAPLLSLYHDHILPDDRGTGPILIRDRAELLERDEARTQLGITEGRAVYVTLGGGGDLAAPRALPKLVDALVEAGWHVVVGAGPLYDGPERRGPKITWLSRYTPVELLPGVDAAVSAGGYNTFHELMLAGVPTVFVPQPRIADDQEERVQRAVDAGVGVVAESLDDVPNLLETLGDGAGCAELVADNGARRAAIQVLATVIPEGDLKVANDTLSDALLRLLRAGPGEGGELGRRALQIVRLLAGGTPEELRRRRAVTRELEEQGVDVPPEDTGDVGDRVQRFVDLCRSHEIPFDLALSLVKGLAKKFPAARGAELAKSVERLFPLWATFDDWMGAVSLLRAVPKQRTLTIGRFTDLLVEWLEAEEDLFDALRAFSRLERRGERTVAETLHLLTREVRA